jgi:hypothetical protein
MYLEAFLDVIGSTIPGNVCWSASKQIVEFAGWDTMANKCHSWVGDSKIIFTYLTFVWNIPKLPINMFVFIMLPGLAVFISLCVHLGSLIIMI